ncbi:Acyl-CoA dehydrogenase [Frankia canadensis]|uniref:Acyl-CoA dehydrogenase n=1 Tax=Frankia canadensis TaxID=1836972 RepID=A0A2I2L2U3_9ACTN|nr:acyl-CoA dehydrogenase family protein [Frankia canadensis]SNQ52234.1 Acyl-CoA dehydrogenase [Frankia canadensis]SOU59524.1 Acyl-CoA dehydrogenase [Frankia canadensis]
MDFGLTDEQRLLQQTAREFVSKVCPPEQAKEWDEAGVYPVELFTQMGDMGWLSLPFPESIGGADGSIVDLCVLIEQLGRASLDIAMCFAGTFIPGLTLFKWGTPEQHERYLPGMMEGRNRFAMAMSEPDVGSDVAALRTSAVDDGDHFIVNGQKAWCTGAGLPGVIMATYVRTDPTAPKHKGMSLLLIDPASPGVEIRRTPTLARHILGTNEVFLTDVRVPKENLVGPLNGAWKVMLSGLDVEKILMSAAYTGTAQSTIDEALAYSLEREAFGRPIGTFQSLAHGLADLQTEIDAARLLSFRAASMLSAGEPCTREGAMAKLKCSETYVAAARLGMQVLAGHGFSTESVMSFRWRESIVATISGGTSQIQRNAIARSMGLRSY